MNTKKLIATMSVLVIGFLIGLTTLSVTAQTGGCVSPGATWTGPTATPTDGNACPPINTGTQWQYKQGPLSIGTNSEITTNTPSLAVIGGGLFDAISTVNLVVSTGTPTIGNVLTAADTQGTVKWSSAGSSGGGIPSNIKVVSTVGGNDWKIPDGVTRLRVRAWGGGGGGANGYGGGGGGGGYAESILTVSPGETYTITVGQGGTASTVAHTDGGGGGDSKFNLQLSPTILVKGAAGGGGYSDKLGGGDYTDAGGLGGGTLGISNVGQITINGGNGATGNALRGSGDSNVTYDYAAGGASPMGGSGGPSYMGVLGKAVPFSLVGQTPGGGGSGGHGGTYLPFDGAPGEVIIEY